MDSTTLLSPKLTTEKLGLLESNGKGIESDALSRSIAPTESRIRALSPTGSVRSAMGSRRTVRRSYRRSSSFMQSHRSSMSKELTSKAESKFFALMELMASASREASSLKEIWLQIISERESWASREEELLAQIEEYCETIEQKEREHGHHHHEHERGRATIETQRLEIVALSASIAEYKKKVTQRDHEVERIRREFHEYKESNSHVREQYEKIKSSYERVQLTLKACEDERDHYKEDAEKHHSELRSLTREHLELKSTFTDISEKYEVIRKDISSYKEKISIFEKERDEWLHEKGQFEEDLRKSRHRYEECNRKLIEITEKYEKKVREETRLHETIKKVETEREELIHKIEHLQREIDTKACGWEDAEERCGKWKLKCEHFEREVITLRDRIKLVEVERTELHESVTKIREEYRLLIIERDQLKEDYHHECKKASDHHHKVLILQESLRRTESTLTEVREEVHTLTERISRIESERDSAVHKYKGYEIEITELKSSIQTLNAEIVTITKTRDNICDELNTWRQKCETITETHAEYEDNHEEYEFEIESLRTRLNEAREQKEKAISARNSADRERDEAISRYEEKCREMERMEASYSHHFHSGGHDKSRGRIVYRTTSSSTAVNGESHGHSHSQSHGHSHNSYSHGHNHAGEITSAEG